jgi:hypothetical protein
MSIVWRGASVYNRATGALLMSLSDDIQEAGRATTRNSVAPRVFASRNARFLYWRWR